MKQDRPQLTNDPDVDLPPVTRGIDSLATSLRAVVGVYPLGRKLANIGTLRDYELGELSQLLQATDEECLQVLKMFNSMGFGKLTKRRKGQGYVFSLRFGNMPAVLEGEADALLPLPRKGMSTKKRVFTIRLYLNDKEIEALKTLLSIDVDSHSRAFSLKVAKFANSVVSQTLEE